MALFTDVFVDVTRKGRKIPTINYLQNGLHPIFDQGQNSIAGYTNETDGLFIDVPAIIFGDHTRILKYIDRPCFLGADGVKLLKAKINNPNYKYLYYALCHADIPNTGYNRHFKWLKEVEIPIPSEREQQQVVSVLDGVSAILALRKQQLTELDNLIKARFVEMFGDMLLNEMGWKEFNLDTLADVVSGITKGRKVRETELIEVPYMAVSNVKDGYIDWTTVKTIMATKQEIEQYRLLPYDVLMTEGGDPDKLGRGAVIVAPLENSIHQNHIFRVRLQTDRILPIYFSQYLQSQKAKKYFLGCAKQTTGIASINMKQLRSLPVLVPPKEKQKQFAFFVEQVDKSKVVVQKALPKHKHYSLI